MGKTKVKFRRIIARRLGSIVDLVYSMRVATTSFKKTPIIILTPGKVGSSSVYYTLKNKTNNPVFHIHRFSEEGIANSSEEHLKSDRKSLPLHLILSKHLRKKLLGYDSKIYVITIIREPISRAISSFFQNTEFYKNKIETKSLGINEVKAKEFLLSNLDKDFSLEIEEWFGDEIKNNFGIDVFKKKFDDNKGYEIYQNGKIHHLLLRMEDLDKVFSEAIQEFLYPKKKIELQRANIGDEKHYASSYSNIKRDIQISPERLEQIISSKYFQHFYSEKEIEVKQKWIQN